MVSLDFRTRFDSDIAAVDVAEFLERQLPDLAAARADLAIPGALELGVDPFTIDTGDGAWTLSIGDGSVQIARGDGGRAVVRLSAAELTDIVFDLQTPMTLLTAGTLRMERGNLGHFLDWWVVLRSLIDGVPVHTAGSVAFHDRHGDPLDLHRSFALDDDPDDVAHFLSEAGYLHLTDVFTEEEMAAVSADIDSAAPGYDPDDGRSWWARTAAGDHRPVRFQWFQEHSPTTTALLDDDRFLRGRPVDHRRLRGADRRQSGRGLGEAHRCRRGHLRPALAQGLQSREALVPVLWADRWYFGDGRRRAIGSARRRRRLPPCSRPARVCPAQLGTARDRPRDRPPAT